MINRRCFLAALFGAPLAMRVAPIVLPAGHWMSHGRAAVIPSFTAGHAGFHSFGAGTLAMLHGSEQILPGGLDLAPFPDRTAVIFLASDG